MIRMILTDLDHTLLKQDGSVSGKTLQILTACCPDSIDERLVVAVLYAEILIRGSVPVVWHVYLISTCKGEIIVIILKGIGNIRP